MTEGKIEFILSAAGLQSAVSLDEKGIEQSIKPNRLNIKGEAHMGTNYYLFTDRKQLARKSFAEVDEYGNVEAEYAIVDDPRLGYLIHLNKCSYGWRPLFQCHKAFQSFADLESFYKKNEKFLTVLDEYGKEYEWEDYKQIVVAHGNRKATPVKWAYETDKLFSDGKNYLHTIEFSPDEAELWSPFDHLQYAKTKMEAAKRFQCFERYLHESGDFYSHNDEEYPVDWAKGDFS